MQPTRRAALAVLLACAVMLTTACTGSTTFNLTRGLKVAADSLTEVQDAEIAWYCQEPNVAPCPDGSDPDQEDLRVRKPDGSFYITTDDHVRSQGHFEDAWDAVGLTNDALQAGAFEDAKTQIRIALDAINEGIGSVLGGLSENTRLALRALVAVVQTSFETLLALMPGDSDLSAWYVELDRLSDMSEPPMGPAAQEE